MPKYRVEVSAFKEYRQVYVVEAPDAQSARERYDEGDLIKDEYLGTPETLVNYAVPATGKDLAAKPL